MNTKTSRKYSVDEEISRKLGELAVLRERSDKLHENVIRIYGEVHAEAIRVALITFGVQSVVTAGYIGWRRPDNVTLLVAVIAVFVVSILVYEFVLKFHPANKHCAVLRKQRHELREQLGALKREILED